MPVGTMAEIDERVEPELYELEAEGFMSFAPARIEARSFQEVHREMRQTKTAKERRLSNPQYVEALTDCANFLIRAKNGNVSDTAFREVLSTSDFPILFGDILDMRLLNQYNITPNTWSTYAQRGTVPDFRQSRIIALDGLQKPLYPINNKPELSGVQYDDSLTETGYLTQVQVYERGFAFNWRMLINSRGNFLSRVPMLLGRAAQRTEERFATGLYVASTGPNTTYFAAGNKNQIITANGASINNPSLSVNGLKDALNVMYGQLDSDGQPIEIEGVVLVVPPLLRVTAMEIIKATQLELVPAPGATTGQGTRVFTPPWVNDFRISVNWYQPIVDVSANKNTTWYVFADPNANRPAMEVTFLSGYEQPSLWQKAPNTMRMGGGVDPMMGDWEDMDIKYKILHIIGGVLLDSKVAAVSLGTNT